MAVHSGEAPAESTGPVHYSVGLLSSRQFDDLGDVLEYAVEEQLRGLATREGVLTFGLAVAELLVTRARPLYSGYDRRWP